MSLYLILPIVSANVLKPNLEKKKTVAVPDVDDFDDQVGISIRVIYGKILKLSS
jgi:hypothetical protein